MKLVIPIFNLILNQKHNTISSSIRFCWSCCSIQFSNIFFLEFVFHNVVFKSILKLYNWIRYLQCWLKAENAEVISWFQFFNNMPFYLIVRIASSASKHQAPTAKPKNKRSNCFCFCFRWTMTERKKKKNTK